MVMRQDSGTFPGQPPPPGWGQTPQSSQQLPMKNAGTAAVIALIVGAILFWGVGHIYVGKVLKGIGIMIAGWVIGGLFVLSFLSIIAVGIGGLAVILLFALLALGGWIWQTFDAYSLAKQYNDYVRTHGVEPW